MADGDNSGAHVAVLIDPESLDSSEPQLATGVERVAAEEAMAAPGGAAQRFREEEAAAWRQEVASRVDAYRMRRGRKRFDHNASLDLDFGPTFRNHSGVAERRERERRERELLASQAPGPRLVETSNVIEFPRPVPQPLPFIEELAEPILEKPRILDAEPVEEESALQFGGEPLPSITLEPAPESRPQKAEASEAEIEVAPLAQRGLAGALDGMIVLSASALFATIFFHLAATVPPTRSLLVLAVLVPGFFWELYHYLFLVHAAATPGMRLAQLRLSTFDGGPPGRSLRRWRAVAMVVSCMSLGMGFAWAAIDEYGLCWHDRITRTYLRRKD